MNPTTEMRLEARNKPLTTAIMHQKWRNLLFLHWEIDPLIIQMTLPKGLYVDTFQEMAYIGIIPFYIDWLSISKNFKLPFLSKFLEINLRTYVYDDKGTPGVWFYSLDIDSAIATFFARKGYYLPYVHSKIEAQNTDGLIDFCVQRHSGPHKNAQFRYKPKQVFPTSSLEDLNFFLVERYILFTEHNQKIYKASVHHTPYKLFDVDVFEYSTKPFIWNGFAEPLIKPDHCIYSDGVDVDIFGLQKVS